MDRAGGTECLREDDIVAGYCPCLGWSRRSAQLLTESDRWISEGSSKARAEVQILPDFHFDELRPEAKSEAVRSLWLGVQWDLPDDWRGDPTIETLPELKVSPYLRRNPPRMRKYASSATWDEASRGFFYAAYGPFRRLTGAGPEAQRLMLAPREPRGRY
jgi:hypothetical protein